MNIEEILASMDEVLDKAVAVPFSGRKSLIDVETMNDLVNEIRLNLPREISQARDVVNERKSLVNDANTEADKIIKRAEERAKQLVSAQEITRMAQAKAQEIMIAAQQKSNELRNATNDYIENMLNKNEELLSRNISEIRKARTAYKNSGK